MIVCLTWFAIDSAFEFGQRQGAVATEVLPTWLEKIPMIRNLGDYFENGTFDPFDLVSIGFGSLVAIVIGKLTLKKGGSHENART